MQSLGFGSSVQRTAAANPARVARAGVRCGSRSGVELASASEADSGYDARIQGART